MGALAFAVLLLAELGTSIVVFGNSWSGYLDSFKSTAAIQGQQDAGRKRG